MIAQFQRPAPLTGIAGELETITSRMGHSYNWRNLLTSADDELLQALHRTMRLDGSTRDQIILNACCEGYDSMGRILGKGGQLKATAVRYMYHALATVDFSLEMSDALSRNERLTHSTAISPVQYSYRMLTPPTGKRHVRPLTVAETRMAKSICIAKLATDYRQEPTRQSMDYIAEHYDELQPYFSTIINTKDTRLDFLENLVEVQPASALIGGLL